MYFLIHRRQLEDYHRLEDLGTQYRLGSVSYSDARR